MNKTFLIAIGTAIGGFVLANLIDYSPFQVVMKGDLNGVIDRHALDVKVIKIQTLDVKAELAEEQIRRLSLTLLENRVLQEKLTMTNQPIPVVYKEQETELTNEISNLSSTLAHVRSERVNLIQ